ncbi:hypothetical protein AVEN_78833-1 [Araneus ventricosus]|uniref:Uncharacterized protein n=1 Tax=Araneus ventricosus TaxID=182803 RepID=A0A4Y2V397_ARAVE|nr:hypothetical protein AVEN_78833-1 [Araneus ventricosus]
MSDYGQSERGSSKGRLHRFPSILAAPEPAQQSQWSQTPRPRPTESRSPARCNLLFAAKPQSPGREPGGPSSFLQSQSLSPSEIDDNKIPDTGPKRVKNTTLFSSKVSSRVGKLNF